MDHSRGIPLLKVNFLTGKYGEQVRGSLGEGNLTIETEKFKKCQHFTDLKEFPSKYFNV